MDDLLMNGTRGVDYCRLDYLALDDGLDVFVHVMVGVLAGDGGALDARALYR
jgi:hypothetical protein